MSIIGYLYRNLTLEEWRSIMIMRKKVLPILVAVLKIKGKTAVVKYSKLRKKTQSPAVTKVSNYKASSLKTVTFKVKIR